MTMPGCVRALSLTMVFVCLGVGISYADLNADYQRAVADAQLAEPDEIHRDLIAITASEPGLVWEGEPGNSRVLAVSWVGNHAYNTFFKGNEGKEILLSPTYNVWVTMVPELQNFFQDRDYFPASRAAAELRIKQLLGLPVSSTYMALVEMWVEPTRLFRPSPDPEIIDHEAVLEFSPAGSIFLSFNSSVAIHEYNSADGSESVRSYEQWFDNLKNSTYTGNPPYPWTRLGYTYDWNSSSSEFGLSEFIVLGNSTVKVQSVTVTEDMLLYFSRPKDDFSGLSGSSGCMYNPQADNDLLYVFVLMVLVVILKKYRAHTK